MAASRRVARAWGVRRPTARNAPTRSAPLRSAQAEPRPQDPPEAAWLAEVLAAVVVLYALQTLYSPDFSKSLQNVCFFFVPFSLAYRAAARRRVGPQAAGCSSSGSSRWRRSPSSWSARSSTRPASLFWNDQVIRSNDFHTYFRVNSVFWDPNIYGRYLALAIVIAMAALLWARERRAHGAARRRSSRPLARPGCRPSRSRASPRCSPAWRCSRPCAGAGAGRWPRSGRRGRSPSSSSIFAGGSRSSAPTASTSTPAAAPTWSRGGRRTLRPAARSGATAPAPSPRAYREHVATRKAPVSVSHTEPVTVAAEQGADRPARLRGAARRRPLDDGGRDSRRRAGPRRRLGELVGRAAVLAAFVALLVHTMAYAGFFEDPITWVLLAAGASLAARPGPRRDVVSRRVGIPAPPRDDRRRLHRGEHPLEADRGRAAAALHALPDPRRLRRRRGDVRRGGRGQHRRSASA